MPIPRRPSSRTGSPGQVSFRKVRRVLPTNWHDVTRWSPKHAKLVCRLLVADPSSWVLHRQVCLRANSFQSALWIVQLVASPALAGIGTYSGVGAAFCNRAKSLALYGTVVICKSRHCQDDPPPFVS